MFCHWTTPTSCYRTENQSSGSWLAAISDARSQSPFLFWVLGLSADAWMGWREIFTSRTSWRCNCHWKRGRVFYSTPYGDSSHSLKIRKSYSPDNIKSYDLIIDRQNIVSIPDVPFQIWKFRYRVITPRENIWKIFWDNVDCVYPVSNLTIAQRGKITCKD